MRCMHALSLLNRWRLNKSSIVRRSAQLHSNDIPAPLTIRSSYMQVASSFVESVLFFENTLYSRVRATFSSMSISPACEITCIILYLCAYTDANIGYTTTTKRFSAYTLRGQSPSNVSAKPLSGSGITDLYHSNVATRSVWLKECMTDSA